MQKDNKCLDNFQQPRRIMEAFSTKSKVQKGRKEPLHGSCSGSKDETDNTVILNSSGNFSKPAENDLLQHICLNTQRVSVWNPSDKETRVNVNSQHGRDSLEKLFLDFESIRLMKEEADEDSASDLSDSERVPIPPSPLTPPELILRAEQIDPGCFSQHTDSEVTSYKYPDFLPPPFNSWNLPQLAKFVNTEGTHILRPNAAGFLDRYVERLLQLEWLQKQTVQNEKSKVVKSRPKTSTENPRIGKATKQSKSWHIPTPSKQPIPSDNIGKMTTGQENKFHSQATTPFCSRKCCAKVCQTKELHFSVQKHSQEVTCVAKKRPLPNTHKALDLPPFECNPKIQNLGNIRPQKQSTFLLDSQSTLKLKKNNNLKRTVSLSTVKTSCKIKPM
ncbi:protein FAM217B isoform 1-T2 [Discoglossus pictus]